MTSRPTGHRARKRFGQNFLRDPGIISRLVRAIGPRPGQRLVEVGPGQGALTEPLLEAADGHLEVIELDRDLIPGLRVQFFDKPGFVIHEGDALKFDFRELRGDGPALRVVGNLPYNISTPLISHLLAAGDAVSDMHFMLQKEVVERLAAEPGGTERGRLSVLAQYHCRVESLFTVPPEAFVPRPKVESAIVRLTPHETPPHRALDESLMFEVVREAFAQRRKTLRNNLKSRLSGEALSALDIDPGRRPQTLSVAEFVRIADHLAKEGS
ncbi:16S rRNA (adenine(1518)-N(6)/adenine(1519)-N(6))-dimethyltransferase RsmA [Halomonas elongata]|uniref:Ribosomal RNA small subunit methyltransferase A n=2 Tax=Halomonas elongata TaxID=2746 RepID=E1V6Y7_HALED|nr:16S rRNA (adenine(1518)-N(6)/adenine(1519)-N(6))-dimethyltransferase RsmA [Halomonas elongata]MDL4862732.1 16S rRNA (adenine(1518)-N(6)/adenine(1519)-N(6))-dimethyltransferase RsmA [Halomonas elongata]OBX34164.1 ribosomal RNA small subunit methyltransferase A [Halomonas elongata]RAW09071.1 16S rRNA (adenine(1518)-N(6)/adenine(1519)-N(6))-dimethyltransferase RsmA [Halomonas elongata]WBF17115.1 16S rRNA (adenine(1518)-N(6)/adenine(1519)-N(6))-dimethyltransferase RsmA [Halomonas elongata]WPU45